MQKHLLNHNWRAHCSKVEGRHTTKEQTGKGEGENMQVQERIKWAVVLMILLALGLGEAQAGTQETNVTTVAVNIAESIAVVAWPDV